MDLAWEGSVCRESRGSKDEMGRDVPGDGEQRGEIGVAPLWWTVYRLTPAVPA